MNFRNERDALGSRNVPVDKYYGIQTLRALENFTVSDTTIGDMPILITCLAMVKKAAALANYKDKSLSEEKLAVIVLACDEIIAGNFRDMFVVDAMQGGAGTSTNMNMNEVIANRALELLGQEKGRYGIIHPLGDVNRSQSTNDAYATAIRMSVCFLNEELIVSLNSLHLAFEKKSCQFSEIQKLGRTQLQDAVPMTVGAELHAFAVTIEEDVKQLRQVGQLFLEVNLGGTAIGSGVGASANYSDCVIQYLATVSGLEVKRSTCLFEASWDMGAFIMYSGAIKRVATKLSKIANDLRLLSSGPTGGIGEYILPAQQPGSSLMPGKVNPVIPELMNIVCFRAMGADTAITFAAEAGQLQLNANEPLIIWSIYETTTLLVNAIDSLQKNCIDGLEINSNRCTELLDQSAALATRLVSTTGYDNAARYAKNAIDQGLSFRTYISNEHPELLKSLK